VKKPLDAIHEFRTSSATELLELLKCRQVLPEEQSEAVVHALVDIGEAVEKLYCDLIPKIINDTDGGTLLQDHLWDVREEFRHIDYHLHDSNLVEQ
jgi:hypothetical protein